MTQQLPHWVFYRRNRYGLITWFPEVKALLDEWGIRPELFSTACWLGYTAEYIIESNQLFLTRLNVANLYGSKTYINHKLPSLMAKFPPIGNVRPTYKFTGILCSRMLKALGMPDAHSADVFYSLKQLCPVNGSIAMIRGRYNQPPYFLRQTLKITLEQGYIKDIRNITRELRAIQYDIQKITEEARKLPPEETLNYRQDEKKALYKERHNLLGKTI